MEGQVTSYTEVWIEMSKSIVGLTLYKVTSYTEVWIEINGAGGHTGIFLGHLLYGGVD